jgi:hypothetical protein
VTASEIAPAWLRGLNGNPVPWLLEEETPAVRHLALRQLLGRGVDDPQVKSALAAAMQTGPIAAILEGQAPEGYWVKPGAGYATKYRGTVWELIFLDQMGADPGNPRVRKAGEYVLEHAQAESGGFSASGTKRPGYKPPSLVVHCLNGNLLRALLGFGFFDDERVQHAIDWQARSITGEGDIRYYASGTSGPGFGCGANGRLPCAWGAIKAMLALARIPPEKRSGPVQAAVQQGGEFLLSRDPAVADYPVRAGGKRSGSWFKPGFPSGYVADVLQNLEVLCELGFAGDSRLRPAVEWLLSKQDAEGRWKNEYAYNGKTRIDFEKQGEPSKWVTLRACRVLKAVGEAGSGAR